MSEIKKVEKTSQYSPNVVAVVNAPELIIPSRIYIFDRFPENPSISEITKSFGSIDKAVEIAIGRLNKLPKTKELELLPFRVAFVFGDNPKQNNPNSRNDQDVFEIPFQYSQGDLNQPRGIMYALKDMQLERGRARLKLDSFPIILDDEQMSIRIKGYKRHISEFPDLTRLRYIE